MATKFQKLFMSKREKELVNIIEKSNVVCDIPYDYDSYYATTRYTITQKDLQIHAKQDWHYAEGKNYTLVVLNNGVLSNIPKEYISDDSVESYRFAKKIFFHMQNKFITQKR